ncbi:MAG: hypothetical protein EOM80_17430, partial [Erysipelotrichia bacterium]|nr:hypothetical protein [Erysipelotrichia bacterium]
MNEIKIKNTDFGIVGVIAGVLLVAVICAGIVYYYRGASGRLESELADVERVNHELASETRQLQSYIASHGAGIKNVRGAVRTSRKRIEHIHSEIEQSTSDAGRAIEIIEKCQEIIEK